MSFKKYLKESSTIIGPDDIDSITDNKIVQIINILDDESFAYLETSKRRQEIVINDKYLMMSDILSINKIKKLDSITVKKHGIVLVFNK
jgi:hypothetical protein